MPFHYVWLVSSSAFLALWWAIHVGFPAHRKQMRWISLARRQWDSPSPCSCRGGARPTACACIFANTAPCRCVRPNSSIGATTDTMDTSHARHATLGAAAILVAGAASYFALCPAFLVSDAVRAITGCTV